MGEEGTLPGRTRIAVVGAGIAGVWAALTLARRGHKVRLIEQSGAPFSASASKLAGAMLAPYCEAESSEPIVREMGLKALPIWLQTFPGIVQKGSLVLAPARDRGELNRYARLTQGHRLVNSVELGALEPDLGGRFSSGLYYPSEAHMDPLAALRFLLNAFNATDGTIVLGHQWTGAGCQVQPPEGEGSGGELMIDCRGFSARAQLPKLRGVRGERLVIRTSEVSLSRPVRLLHPRFPLYVVPWSEHRFMVGATVIESEEDGPVTVRSALELLGMAYALHPAFGEAEILDVRSGVRPAFPDNVPRILVGRDRIWINGMYRHGFLMAPILAELVADYVDSGARHPILFAEP